MTRNSFVNHADRVERLEVFQSELTDMGACRYFTSLTELCLVMQPAVTEIRGMERLRLMRAIWIVECSLRSLSGLAPMSGRPSLTRLFLDENEITSLAGIGACAHLETLSLAGNRITEESLVELQFLPKLTNLNVARNRLRSIGTSLDANSLLEELNVADNLIGDFKDISNLGRLHTLRVVFFSDPHYGHNPLCHLSNYQTQLLYHLPQITELDGNVIPTETKQLAEATYLKKTMYYNMRIKTLQRNLSLVLKLGVELKTKYRSTIDADMSQLRKQQCAIQKIVELAHVAEHGGLVGRIAGQAEALLPRKYATFLMEQLSIANQQRLLDALRGLSDGMRGKALELAALDTLVSELRARARACGDEQISRLMLELRTGGNVRLEEGRPCDSWFGHCDELMQSRFNSSALRKFGVGRLVVHRVTRVHNRLLGNRYERRKAKQAEARRSVLLEKRDAVAKKKAAELKELNKRAAAGDADAAAAAKSAAKAVAKSTEKGSKADSTTPPVEFLFMCESAQMVAHSGVGHEILRAIQHGFRTPEANSSRGFHGGVVLSNSVDTCMAPRLRSLASATGHSSLSGGATWADIERQMSLEDSSGALGADDLGSTMQLMIAKVCPGRCAKLNSSELETLIGNNNSSSSADGDRLPPMSPDSFPGFMSACGPLRASGASATTTTTSSSSSGGEGGSAAATSNTAAAEPIQMQPVVWFVKDPELVLPEYLVEFSLHPTTIGPSLGDPESDDEADADTELLGLRVGETPSVSAADLAAGAQAGSTSVSASSCGGDEPLFDREMREVERLIASGELSELSALLRPLRSFRRRCRKNAADARRASRAFAEALVLPPALATMARVVGILDASIAAARGLPREIGIAANAKSIVYLNLHNNGITSVRGMEVCVNLETLVLSYNAIGSMADLFSLPKLMRLDLGSNLIDRVEGLKRMPALRELALYSNRISALTESVAVISTCVPSIEALDLQRNRVCSLKGYRGAVLRNLPKLVLLDGVVVSDVNRLEASSSGNSITPELVRANGSTAYGRPIATLHREGREEQHYDGSSSPIARAAGARSGSDMDTMTRARVRDERERERWWLQVEALDLSGQRLHQLHNLERLCNLRRANFQDNELTRADGLEHCPLLEELCLEENLISTLDGLQNLTSLRRLDLGKNRLSPVGPIVGLERLHRLTQLSLEDNEISSLHGLTPLRNLMELYIMNNNVEELRQLQSLKDLPKLIILDLSGNPLCSADDYRLYAIYHLAKLKVLDGVGVTQPEVGAARQRYAGRVDRDFLEDRLGSPRDWDSVTVLDLSGQKLRQIDQLSSSEFKHLRELNLNENMLTALGGLNNLPELRTLRLNRNKIQSLGKLQMLTSSSSTNSQSGSAKSDKDDSIGKAIDAASSVALAAASGVDGGALGPLGLAAMGLISIEELQLGYNRVTDVQQLNLSGMTMLRVLVLQGNDISELDGLENLPGLQELVLDKNRIRCLDCFPLRNCALLRSLHVEDNGLRRLKNMDAVAFSLETLHLGTNRLNDLQVRLCYLYDAAQPIPPLLSHRPHSPTHTQELDHLAALGRLHVLTLHKNPVARRQQYRFAIIHALPGIHVLDGKEISAEERERVDLAYMQAPQVYVNEVSG